VTTSADRTLTHTRAVPCLQWENRTSCTPLEALS